MYHIVICDDEPIFLTQISEMIIDILASMGESCEIRKYTSISELKNTLQNTPKSCDILILDIMLGENNGISFAECLRDTENQIPVIFISSSKEFVFDAYSAEPVGYILKPVSSVVSTVPAPTSISGNFSAIRRMDSSAAAVRKVTSAHGSPPSTSALARGTASFVSSSTTTGTTPNF